MTTITAEEQDLAQIIKDVLSQYTNDDADVIVGIKNVISECCKSHRSSRAVIWAMLEDQEKAKFKELLSSGTDFDPYEFPKGFRSIKPPSQSATMWQQNCITELLTGKRWRRAMLIASKVELETALGSLGNSSDRYVAIKAFIERLYPEKKERFPVKKKIFK